MTIVEEDFIPQTCAEAAAAAPFKTGDIVHLNSGGPPMTVRYVDGRYADCIWFVGGEFNVDEFPHECLVAAPQATVVF